MQLKPTRLEAEVEIDPKPEYKSTGKVIFAMGIVGYTDPKPAVPASEGVAAVDAVPAVPIWGADVHMIQIRRATSDPTSVKTAMADALRKIATEIESANV